MKKTGEKVLIIVLVLLIVLAGIFIALKKFKDSQKQKEETMPANTEEKVEEIVEEKKVEIFSGEDRPIAFMIDNNVNAQPQAGIDKAYVVYEMIVEGGETRLMALFKGVTVDKIGPIRSSRHYFLDYALENDAIYVHLGWSPQAESQISSFGVNNINGQYYDTGAARTATSKFWRETGRSAPHNALTNTEMILNICKDLGYRTTSQTDSVLNYVTEEVTNENGIDANTVSIPYSGNSHIVKYEYNEETQRYTRYSKGKKQTEWISGNDITTKNIIITFANNYTLNDGENKGRQDVTTVGSLKGYYITNGKAIEITCEKSSRTAQTVYKDLSGKEIEVNDGNTFIQICPINANVTIN